VRTTVTGNKDRNTKKTKAIIKKQWGKKLKAKLTFRPNELTMRT